MTSRTLPLPVDASADRPRPVSLLHLYLLRALYLLVVVGLGVTVWPGVLHPGPPRELMEGVVGCMLAAFSALCVLGLRHPLQMLPLLLWELLWKSIWLATIALPQWQAGRLDAGTEATAIACLLVVVFPFAVPWRYVFERYLRMPGESWR
jgi:hypothetical protein